MENFKKEYLKTQDRLKDERIVEGVGNIILTLGLISSIILFFVAFFQEDRSINWNFIMIAVYQSLVSFTIWGVLRMLSNISTTLKTKN